MPTGDEWRKILADHGIEVAGPLVEDEDEVKRHCNIGQLMMEQEMAEGDKKTALDDPNKLDAINFAVKKMVERIQAGDLEVSDAICAMRNVGKEKVQVRSVVAEGVGGNNLIEDITVEAKTTNNEFLNKFCLFIGIEGKADGNSPLFVTRLIKPTMKGYADQFESFAGTSPGNRNSYTLAQKESTDIDETMTDIENFFKWVLKRWEA